MPSSTTPVDRSARPDPLAPTPTRARSTAARVRKWGPDLVIRVPPALVRDLGLHEDDVVDVRFRKRTKR